MSPMRVVMKAFFAAAARPALEPEARSAGTRPANELPADEEEQQLLATTTPSIAAAKRLMKQKNRGEVLVAPPCSRC